MSLNEEGNLSAPSTVRALLAREGIRPRKRWGQHFLVDRNTLLRIVDAAQIEPEDGALEIGAGLGTLTQELSRRAAKVVTVEIDPVMRRLMERTLAGLNNILVMEGDFLKQRMDALLSPLEGRPIRVVANVPYYITSPILERLLAYKERFKKIVILVQKEFAARLSAAPNTPDYGSLTLFANYHAQVKTEFIVSKSVFYPPPEVDSAVVSLTPLPARVPPEIERLFFLCTRAAFAARRKTLLNALLAGLGGIIEKSKIIEALNATGIDPMRRGETLSLDEFLQLAENLHQAQTAA